MSRHFTRTSQYLPRQFPSLYLEDGPNFVAFVEEYYAWLETESPLYKARLLASYGDVDDTEEELLSHYVYKYMAGIPVERLGDKRFIAKHVLDLYRSKGSAEGLRLLFRLLYGEEINYRIPSRDMLSPSAGTWTEPRYLEVSFSSYNGDFYQKRLTGLKSGATALVEDYVVITKRGRPSRAFFLSNIKGSFQIGEAVTYSGLNVIDAPIIVGSAGTVVLTDRVSDSTLSDRYDHVGGALVRIASVRTLNVGAIDFTIEDGGYGYTLTADVTVMSGGMKTEAGEWVLTEHGEYLDCIIEGTGAGFEVAALTDTETLTVGTTLIGPYDNDNLDDATFLYNPTVLTENYLTVGFEDGSLMIAEGSGATINDDVTIGDWEGAVDIEVGTIERIAVSSDGSGYIVDADVIVEDELILAQGISDGSGGLYGGDATVTGDVIYGSNVSTSAVVVDSGFGYREGEELQMSFAGDEYLVLESGHVLVTEASETLYYGRSDDLTVTAVVSLSAVGKSLGFWKNNDGMLNSEKRIQDSYYYQEYSYDIESSKSKDKYEGFLKKTYHPAGVEMFGTAVLGGQVSVLGTVDIEVEST